MGSSRKITSLLLMFCLVVLVRAEYAKYKDPNQPLSVRIKDLLGRMTLAEKIGQMTQIERVNATAEAMSKYFIGASCFTHAKQLAADGEGLQSLCVTN